MYSQIKALVRPGESLKINMQPQAQQGLNSLFFSETGTSTSL